MLYHSYRIGRGNRWIYDRYVGALRQSVGRLRQVGLPIVGRPALGGRLGPLRLAWQVLTRRAARARL